MRSYKISFQLSIYTFKLFENSSFGFGWFYIFIAMLPIFFRQHVISILYLIDFKRQEKRLNMIVEIKTK